MTRFHKEDVLCPHCANEVSALIWDRVDVAEDPDLKLRLLKKELQSFECENCGERSILAEPLLYLDAGARCAYFYCPEHEALLKGSGRLPENLALPGLAELLGPGAEAGGPWQLRLTCLYNDLIEKVHLRDAGLDDRLMELVKLALRTRLLEAQGVRLAECYFLAAEEERLFFQVRDEETGWNRFEGEREIYANAQSLLAEQLPEDGGWRLIDADWALRFVKEQG